MKFPDDFVESAGVWSQRSSGATFDYCEAMAGDKYLAEVFARTNDLSSRSVALRDAIVDRSSRYHLSPERSNLLRCLKLNAASHVLEWGAGCGAITRYLGERCASVLAVEGSPAQASLCRARCRGQSQVQVVIAEPLSLKLQSHFDLVTLIGVLPHAGVNGEHSEDPWQHLLQAAAELLRPGGQLIVAVENQLGLNWFSGNAERFKQRAALRVEGYPDDTGGRTFGRRVLMERLQRAGLDVSELILPYPDYQLPDTFVNAMHCDAASAKRFGLADWCRRPLSSFEPRGNPQFDEHLVLSQMAENGLLADISNCFLLVGTKGGRREDSPIAAPGWVACRYNTVRYPAYQCVTTLKLKQGAPLIEKELLDPQAAKLHYSERLEHRVGTTEAYVTGAQTMAFCMLRAIRSGQGAETEFKELLAQWLRFFQPEHAAEGNLNLLRGEFVDCVPDNLVKAAGGPWQYIDREWRYTEPVLLDWVFYRGLARLWEQHSPAIAGAKFDDSDTRREFIVSAFALLGSSLTGAEWDSMQERERGLQQVIRNGALRA